MARCVLSIILLWVVSAGIGLAQNSSDSFTEIPDSLFSNTQYSSEPEVPFLYSIKKLDVTFEEGNQSIVAVLKYHVRVKIFDSSVKEAAVVGIPYYFANNIEQVSDIRGVTWQNPQTKIPLDEGNIRTINLNSRYNIKEFAMPAVEDGSVIEYVYTVRRRYIEELPEFYLAHQVPTQRAEVSITYPKYLRYRGIVQNLSVSVQHNVQRMDTSTVPKVFTYPQPEPVIKENWSVTDIPAVQKENYISSLDDYRGKIKFQLSEFGLPRQTLENSWDFVVAEIRRKQQVTSHINKNEKAQEIGRSIASGLSDSVTVQDSIFKYLNARVNYSGSKAPFSTAGDEPVLQGKPSDQAAINQTLTAMLRGAGIEASPVLISTRESGRINPSFPSFFQFNGQLVHSRIDGKSYYMDASFLFSQPNLIPVDMYSQTGLLLQPVDYTWLDIEPEESAFTIDINIDAKLDRQGNLTGVLKAENAGYPARQIRQQMKGGASVNSIVKQAVLDGYPEAVVSDAEIANVDNFNEPVTLSANFTIPNYGVSFSGGIEYRPMVVGYLRENPFDDQQRDLPVTLDAPEHLNLTYSIELPNGMSLVRRPQNQGVQLPGATFNEQYNLDSNILQYQFQIDISQKQFAPDLYSRLLNLYRRWVQLSNTQWRIQR